MKAYAVIGANFGDEGKGVITDALCRKLIDAGVLPIVCRHNGSAQASHTVTLPAQALGSTLSIGKRRHRFSHFGSGTFADCPTYLARSFYCSPAAFHDEWLELENSTPIVICDPRSPVILPMDIAINRLTEIRRGDARHGSCGMGFFPAFQRSNAFGASLTIGELADAEWQIGLDRVLKLIEPYYAAELERLGISRAHAEEFLEAEGIAKKFKEGTSLMGNVVRLEKWESFLGRRGSIVFEGAQGLGLDPRYGTMPHCTPSDCGLRNPVKMCLSAGIRSIEAVYVTRCYQTRHGAGPFPEAQEDFPWEGFLFSAKQMKEDDTNCNNPWQGDIRYAPLDVKETESRIERDVWNALNDKVGIGRSIAVTWLDAFDGQLNFDTQLTLCAVAKGPTAADVNMAEIKHD